MSHEHLHGHGHGHEHEHEHGLGHEHHHHAHEEAIAVSWADVKLEVHTHEQAATVSISISPHASCNKPFSDLVTIMQTIAQAAEDAGGIVGHIKAFAKRGESSVHASVTAAELPATCDGDQSLLMDGDTAIQLVAIVLLIDQSDLLSICKGALAS